MSMIDSTNLISSWIGYDRRGFDLLWNEVGQAFFEPGSEDCSRSSRDDAWKLYEKKLRRRSPERINWIKVL